MDGLLARRLFASVFVSLMAAALLSLLPALQGSREGKDVPAFGSLKQRVLTEETLADFLSGQWEGLRVMHADWDGGDLRLRLKRTEGSRESFYNDMLKMIRGVLVYTSNVDSVTLAVSSETGKALFTVYAARTDLVADPGMKGTKGLTAEEYLKRTFRLKRQQVE